MILYPTETTYGLGVNALDPNELEKLYRLKGRDARKAVSFLVRNLDDIECYAVMSPTAKKVAERFLPGPLTLVLPQRELQFETIGFRVSSDPFAESLIKLFMEEYGAPLTATSANLSGEKSESLPEEILKQFGADAELITEVIDGGVRNGTPSTVVRIHGDSIEVIREGAILTKDILDVVK